MSITKSEVARRLGTADGGVDKLVRAGLLRATITGTGKRLRYSFDAEEVNTMKQRMIATGKVTVQRQVNAIVASGRREQEQAQKAPASIPASLDQMQQSIAAIERTVNALAQAWNITIA